MNIEQFIIDLLKQHNCVVVPNFGGFIANYQPAVIDTVKRTISPPSKQVLFNANLLKNDGLLANYIVNHESISYPESLVQIEEKVKDWKTALTNDKRLVFGEIGFLYEQDGAIVFEQNRESNLWLKAYGLSSIQFVSTKDIAKKAEDKVVLPSATKNIETKTEKAETTPPKKQTEITLKPVESITGETITEQPAKVVPIRTEKKSRRKWGYLAAACAIPLLFYTYWIPMETNFLETGNIKLSDFNPFRQQQLQSVYQKRNTSFPVSEHVEMETFKDKIAELPSDVTVYHFQFDESTYIPVKLEAKPEAQTTSVKDITNLNNDRSVTSSGSNDVANAPFQLIAGCFSIEKNANTLISDLRSNGYSAYILDKNKGLYRVAINGFHDMTAAKTAKKELKTKDISTWILKR